jgi:hypothetical protein
MNAIAAHKDELERLLVNLSRDAAVSRIDFVVLLDAYITRLDAKLLSHKRERRYGAGANKRRIGMEPTLTQNCALYYARNKVVTVQVQMTRHRSKRALYRDNGR